MRLIAFSKHFQQCSVSQLIEVARTHGLDGWDLAVRPKHPVHPDNVATALPEAAKAMRAEGLSLPMVTGNFDLLAPDHPTAQPLLAAMDRADVRFLKLGYFLFDPAKQDYWQEVDRIRRLLEGWQGLSRQYNVRICYHTHSERCMGLNGAAMAHLLRGFDPRCIGAYLDPAHLLVEGEEFAVALAMVKEYLSLVALKDVRIDRQEAHGHGKARFVWLGAGEGMVDWTTVLADLKGAGFDGPMSVHCEFVQPGDPAFAASIEREIAFFRRMTEPLWGPVTSGRNRP